MGPVAFGVRTTGEGPLSANALAWNYFRVTDTFVWDIQFHLRQICLNCTFSNAF